MTVHTRNPALLLFNLLAQKKTNPMTATPTTGST
ncbi:predicted protein [Chaetomium globosum CBS 148.51]|uniref:Uncharacterized protein n=1 Tax=Chaetomium globosum (strain ATCC 6205 / CBS 148.51 / DSM 1962 / NBRC 6347 / NRRL 1970) TaxID=306901 RepID=Q2H8H1_CHAGB|nr:uncharacterized protein CHGG_03483 [Chaetomium globosum CBS 148.51]EAQ91548.1 predicted protein [Chaetomium globosum CBS 148.51]